MGINRSQPLQYKLRLSEEMQNWLKEQAQKNYRSLNAEITMHLENGRKQIEQQEQHNETQKA